MNCVFGKTVYTGASELRDAYVCFSGTKITAVSRAARGEVLGRYPVVTPAFIDPHSHIGMVRAGEPGDEAEANESMDSILALPDALDSVQTDDAAFAEAVEMGVLYSCVVPGSGNIIGGLSALIRNYAAAGDEALVARAGVKAAFGYNPTSVKNWKGTRPSTRMGALAILRGKLDEIRRKLAKRRKATGRKKAEITFTAAEQVLADLLTRKRTLRVHVHKSDDIAALLRLVDEFKLKVTVEHACDVHRAETFEQLKKRRIPVTYGPVDAFAYKTELKHENWRNIRHLVRSGVHCGLMTDHPVTPARTLFLQTRWFTRAGFSKQQAIELISRRNAELLGVDNLLGTLARGRWASLVCWNGDPFDLTRYPVKVIAEGRVVFEDAGD